MSSSQLVPCLTLTIGIITRVENENERPPTKHPIKAMVFPDIQIESNQQSPRLMLLLRILQGFPGHTTCVFIPHDPPVSSYMVAWKILQKWRYIAGKNPIYDSILIATEGPPTLQSGVIPAWNYVPQLPGKVTPTSSPIVNAARKWKSTKKLPSQMCKTQSGRKSPQWF